MSDKKFKHDPTEENADFDVFAMTLLFDEKVGLPEQNEVEEAASRHLGQNKVFTGNGENVGVACLDRTVETGKGNMPVLLMMSACFENDDKMITDFDRAQLWDCPDHERILSECRYAFTAIDSFGGGLLSTERAQLEIDWLATLLDLFPQCRAVYFANSGKLMETDRLREMINDSDKELFPYMAVNVRYFSTGESDGELLIDTLGMAILGLPDIQYRFKGRNPSDIVCHAYNMACHLLYHDCPVMDGDTVGGFNANGEPANWVCRYETAFVEPPREVISINVG